MAKFMRRVALAVGIFILCGNNQAAEPKIAQETQAGLFAEPLRITSEGLEGAVPIEIERKEGWSIIGVPIAKLIPISQAYALVAAKNRRDLRCARSKLEPAWFVSDERYSLMNQETREENERETYVNTAFEREYKRIYDTADGIRLWLQEKFENLRGEFALDEQNKMSPARIVSLIDGYASLPLNHDRAVRICKHDNLRVALVLPGQEKDNVIDVRCQNLSFRFLYSHLMNSAKIISDLEHANNQILYRYSAFNKRLGYRPTFKIASFLCKGLSDGAVFMRDASDEDIVFGYLFQAAYNDAGELSGCIERLDKEDMRVERALQERREKVRKRFIKRRIDEVNEMQEMLEAGAREKVTKDLIAACCWSKPVRSPVLHTVRRSQSQQFKTNS